MNETDDTEWISRMYTRVFIYLIGFSLFSNIESKLFIGFFMIKILLPNKTKAINLKELYTFTWT